MTISIKLMFPLSKYSVVVIIKDTPWKLTALSSPTSWFRGGHFAARGEWREERIRESTAGGKRWTEKQAWENWGTQL